MLKCGDVLAGQYVVDALVGKGGMSCVYKAHLTQGANKVVAVKELPPTVRLSSGQLVAQGIAAQVKVMKRIDYPGIAKLLDAFRSNDAFYLVFEYVEGRSLQSIVAAQGAIPEKQALAWTLQLCNTLGYLHAMNPPVVYRDMKPSNVLLDENGALKLVDLGIAREFKGAGDQDKDTVAFGTCGYAPPEQYGRAQTDARSDIYALGCTMWQLVTGFPPPMEFPLPAANSVNAQVSAACSEIIATCTQLDRQNRYQTCEALAHDIRLLLGIGEEGEVEGKAEGEAPGGAGGAGAAGGARFVTGGGAGAGGVRAGAAGGARSGAGGVGAADGGPAERLARAFKRILMPLRAHKKVEGEHNAPLQHQTFSQVQSEDQLLPQRESQAQLEAQPLPQRESQAQSGALSLSQAQLETQSETPAQASQNSQNSGRDFAQFCFDHAQETIFQDTPTMLLSSAFDAENYETGELPELFGSQAQTGEFFFTIVQSELFAPGDTQNNSKQ